MTFCLLGVCPRLVKVVLSDEYAIEVSFCSFDRPRLRLKRVSSVNSQYVWDKLLGGLSLPCSTSGSQEDRWSKDNLSSAALTKSWFFIQTSSSSILLDFRFQRAASIFAKIAFLSCRLLQSRRSSMSSIGIIHCTIVIVTATPCFTHEMSSCLHILQQ